MIDFLKGTVTPKDWIAVAGILGIAVAVAAGFYFFIHQAQQEELNQIKNNDVVVKEDLDKARQTAATIDQVRRETEDIENLVSDFEDRLPSKREIVELIRKFEKDATAQNIDVQMTPIAPSADGAKETIPYGVVARGNFHDIASFINSLERDKRFLKVTNLDVQPEVNTITTVRFILNTYRFLQGPA